MIETLTRIQSAEQAQDKKVADGMCFPDWVTHLLESDDVAYKD